MENRQQQPPQFFFLTTNAPAPSPTPSTHTPPRLQGNPPQRRSVLVNPNLYPSAGTPEEPPRCRALSLTRGTTAAKQAGSSGLVLSHPTHPSLQPPLGAVGCPQRRALSLTRGSMAAKQANPSDPSHSGGYFHFFSTRTRPQLKPPTGCRKLMELRFGKTFAPYSLKRIFRWETGHVEPVSTSVDAEPLIQAAVARENEFFDLGGDDSEGLGVTLRPPSPLTDLESGDGTDDDTEATDLPPPPTGKSSGPCSGIEKKRRIGLQTGAVAASGRRLPLQAMGRTHMQPSRRS